MRKESRAEDKYQKDIPKALFYRRKRTPTLIQMEATECGAACLGMILAHYGKHVSLDELRHTCEITRDGASIISIISAAEGYGLIADVHTVDLEGLYNLPLPLIAHWSFRHYLVIEGFSREKVFLNDPSLGPYTISYEELNRAFTGVAVVFAPGVNFKKSGRPKSMTEVVLGMIKQAKIPFGFAFLTGLCLVVTGLAVPAFTQIFIDNILVNSVYSGSEWLFSAMFFFVLITVILKFLQLRVLNRLYIQLSTFSFTRIFFCPSKSIAS
jgi:ABC-type bacteriocin/lantibiotic exporter with double-glycine peptidase domain